MIKNLAIGGVVGLIFMSGGFWFGLRLVHVPVPKKAAAISTAKTSTTPASRDAISIDALRKTSEGMMDVNQALQVREQAVAAREKKAQQVEDELAAERAALDRSHAKFHELYGQFQQRLQLVSASEADQLQRQMEIYTTMDPAQTADLLRALDDGTIVRLFSLMETKSLAKLVAAWKTKYPADSTRLLTALTGMGRVLPQDKMALNDSAAPADANGAPAAASTTDAAPDSGNGTANPASPDAASGDATAPAALSGKEEDVGSPAASSSSADNASAPSDATPSEAAAPAAPEGTAPAAAVSGSDSGSGDNAPSGATSAPSAQSIYSTPDATGSSPAPAPAGDSPPAVPTATPAPAAPASTSLAPPPDAPSSHDSASNSASGEGTEATSVLGVPGETAAQAAAIAQRRTGRLTADISTNRHY